MQQHPTRPHPGGSGSAAVTAALVARTDRLHFLPDHFGKFFVAAESGVFTTMRRLCPQYVGGLWDFYALSNGGALLVPMAAPHYLLRCDGNGYAGSLPAFAAGIGVCAMTYNRLAFQLHGAVFAEMFYRLHDFLAQQPEAGELYALLD